MKIDSLGKKAILSELFGLGAVWGVISAYFFVLYRLWKYDFRVPLQYEGDAPAALLIIKTVVERGSYLVNPDLGWPFGLQWFDYPWLEQWHLVAFRILALFTKNPALIANSFYFLSFLAVGSSAYLVSRRLSFSRISAVISAVLFAFLPYHLFKATNHLFLSDYALIPIALLWAWWLLGNTKLGLPRWVSWRQSWPLWLGLIVTGVISGGSGVYYAFFTTYLIAAAGLLGALRYRRPLLMLLSGLLIGGTLVTLAWSLAPGYLAHRQIGPNPEAARRNPDESQNYGLYFSQIFIPAVRYPFPLTKLQANYSSRGEFTEYFGLVGMAGVLVLLLTLFIQPRLTGKEKVWLPATQVIFFLLFFFGLNNGWGTLFAYLVSPQIRSYTRISPYLAFLAIVLFVWWWEKLFIGNRAWKKYLGMAGLGLIALLSLFDQTLWLKPKFAWNNFRYVSDRSFFSQVEGYYRDGDQPGRVYQVPYVRFPEAVPQYRLEDYDHAKPYLHTGGIQWSYGVIKGREGDRWNQWLMTLPWSRQPRALVGMGFTGLTVDRFAFTDNGEAVLRSLNTALGREPEFFGGDDNRYAFYGLLPEQEKFQASSTAEERSEIERRLRQPVAVELETHRISGDTADQTGRWRWVDQKAKITIRNTMDRPRTVELTGWLATATPNTVKLQQDGRTIATLSLGSLEKPAPFTFNLELPANGQSTLELVTSAPQSYPLAADKPYAYKLIDFAVIDALKW